jgi:hypothetical protein
VTAALIAAAASIVTVFIGYVLTHRSNQRLQQRQDELARVNRQLAELYGPMFVMIEAGRVAFDAFWMRYSPGFPDFNLKPEELSEEQRKAWELWMTKVFQPRNRMMYDLLASKGDLLLGETMPDYILQFCAHVIGYDVLLEEWERGDHSQVFATPSFPDEFTQHVRESYKELKRQQTQLLAQTRADKPLDASSSSVEGSDSRSITEESAPSTQSSKPNP